MVTDSPFVGTVPAKLMTPAAGATTSSPATSPPMSTPRCCPAAYGCDSSYEKGRSTGPWIGQLQALAAGAQAAKRMVGRRSRGGNVVTLRNVRRRLARSTAVVKSAYRDRL